MCHNYTRRSPFFYCTAVPCWTPRLSYLLGFSSSPALPHEILNTLMALSVLVCLVMMALSKESYRRRAFEQNWVQHSTN